MKLNTIAVIIIIGVVYLALEIANRARLKRKDLTFVIPHEIDGKPVRELTSALLRRFRIAMKASKIIVPESVTTIGESAFEDCENLTSVEIPDSVTSIGKGAFGGWASLTSVEIPASVKLGKDVFPDTRRVVRK